MAVLSSLRAGATTGGNMTLPFPDALQEFKVETSGVNAQHGTASAVGGVTKSGTNEFHGDLFEFIRNDLFNARNYFAQAGRKPEFRRNQYGLTLGGPLQKDKTFFFVDWQGSRLRTGVTRLSTVPALAQRQVDLGPCSDNEPHTSPAHQVADALAYLQNQKHRMRYADYRTEGLPITSSHIESTIKRINQRVKGSEKFWSEAGAEAILQLRADTLSETDPLIDFWERRQIAATGQRNYSLAA